MENSKSKALSKKIKVVNKNEDYSDYKKKIGKKVQITFKKDPY